MKLGLHSILGSVSAVRLLHAGARVVKCVDTWNVAREAATMPHPVLVIGRKVLEPYTPMELFRQARNPRWEAQRYLYQLADGNGWTLAKTMEANPQITVWEGPNEPVFGDRRDPGAIAAMRWYAEFEAERATLLHDKFGRAACVGAFSVGTPDLSDKPNDSHRYALWKAFEPALDAIRQYDGYLGLHEYFSPDQKYDTWLQLRYRRVAEYIRASGRPMVKMLITECGWDGVPGGGVPWRLSGQGADGYVGWPLFPGENTIRHRTLAWYDQELQKDDYVAGAVIFTGGHGWPDHSVEGSPVIDLLIKYMREDPSLATPPPPPVVEPVPQPAPAPTPDPAPPPAPDPVRIAPRALKFGSALRASPGPEQPIVGVAVGAHALPADTPAGDWVKVTLWAHRDALEP